MRGCWIDRQSDGAATMRWFPDGDAWRGEAHFYGEVGRDRQSVLRLERAGAGWRICTMVFDAPLTGSCAPAFFGAPASRPDEAWSEIYATADRLKMVAQNSGASARTIIDASRDGCD